MKKIPKQEYTAEFKEQAVKHAQAVGIVVAGKALRRVEPLMRENGIRARHKQRLKATTDSKHSMPVAPNLLTRNCMPRAPNRV